MILIKKRIKKKKENFITRIINRKKNQETLTVKQQVFSMIYFEILGFILCLLLLFVLSGGHNYIRLYKELNKLINVYDTITSNYYGDLNKNEMINNAVESMISEIDDSYTNYTNKEDTTTFLENIDSTYEGIGCSVSVNEANEIYIVSIFENSPASKAGLQEKDIIIKIDNKNKQRKNSEDMAKYIKESKKSKIKLTIKRNNQEKEITIERKKVEIPTVSSKLIEDDNKKIGYIEISVFSSVTYPQFKKELQKLEKDNIQGLIIDVRNNTGGYLSSVTDISSMFLKKGKVIYQLEDEKTKEIIRDKTKEERNYPVAILVNAMSASASEILAASIKESYNGLVVGTNTFGKGTVQKTKKLADGSMIKYTVQKWLTPSGEWINEKGVSPTNFSELRSIKDNEIELQTDKQYDLAVKLITEKIK